VIVSNDVETAYWSRTTSSDLELAGNRVDAFTVEQICEIADFPRIDILKMDIEGAEKEVFGDSDLKFLAKTQCCMVECHDSLADSLFMAAIRKYSFDSRQRGEITIATREKLATKVHG
jgi:hypothetical protein